MAHILPRISLHLLVSKKAQLVRVHMAELTGYFSIDSLEITQLME
jgi:hypothetical protein